MEVPVNDLTKAEKDVRILIKSITDKKTLTFEGDIANIARYNNNINNNGYDINKNDNYINI